MKKSVFFAAIAALVLAGCAKNETYFTQVTYQDEVNFGAYSGRTITKAGPTDDMNLDALKTLGFGVFATYTGTDVFEDADNDKGDTNDFMYNQQVAYNDTENAWLKPVNKNNPLTRYRNKFIIKPKANKRTEGLCIPDFPSKPHFLNSDRKPISTAMSC